MSGKTVSVNFLPSGAKVQVQAGTSLLEAAHAAGLQINAVCGGKGSCGKCRARLIKGALSATSSVETELFSSQQRDGGLILLCQRKALGDVELDLTSASVPAKGFTPAKGNRLEVEFEVASSVEKTFLELSSPNIEDQTADLDRILAALPGTVRVDLKLIREVPAVLRKAGYRVTAVTVASELIGLEAGDTTALSYGIAIDIGTTSVAGYLVNLRDGQVAASTSATNRQRTHGADVISRITYSLENEEGLSKLNTLVLDTLDEVVQKLLQSAQVAREQVYFLTLIGNTVMSHLLMGVSPEGVATSPFVPAFVKSLGGKVRDLGLKSLPGRTRFALLPNIAGYVGSDTVGVILSTQLYSRPGTWLAVDIGTNGEIALSSEGRVLTCSTAAGPAFEGACISQGMRAEPGAIYKVDMDSDVRLETVGGVAPQGICGSGLIDAVAGLVRLGVLKANGRFKKPEECSPEVSEQIRNRIRPADNGWKFVLAEGSQEVALSQKDISELQLGKGAVRAGIEVLMAELGITAEQLDGILVAGAFGSNLRPESIKGIGMFPEVDLPRLQAVGNAAGTGAIMALVSKEQLRIAGELPHLVEHIELSLHEGFARWFSKAISF